MNLDPPQSMIELVKGNSSADMLWKRWFSNLYSWLTSTIQFDFSTASAATTINSTVTLCDSSGGAFTVTLPPAADSENTVYIIKEVDGGVNQVTIDGNGSEAIDGALTLVLAAARGYAALISDGTEWHRIG